MFRIYTDTSANLPSELIRQYDLAVIPFHYTINGKEYPAAAEGCAALAEKPFYDAMRKGAAVQTSMINTSAFGEAFEKSLAAGIDVVYIGMSSGISGAYQASVIAADEMRKRYPERKIVAIDTRAASLGEGLPVLYAASLQKAGASWAEVVAGAEKNRDSICQYFTVDDLMYLKRGGRISGAAAIVGNILHIKPILMGNEEGRIVLHHKERGRKKALAALVNKYQELACDVQAPVGIAHADSEEDAAHLAQMIRASGQQGEIIIACYEPVTGSHVGPGTVALFFYGTHR